MKIVICLDDDLGMTFGGRRQSRDKTVCQRAIDLAKNGKFYVNSFSAKLFAGYEGVTVDDSMLDVAEEGDVCFLENVIPPENTAELVVFKWNRRYPADVHFDPVKEGFSLISSEEFAGNSHEKITMEIYKNEK